MRCRKRLTQGNALSTRICRYEMVFLHWSVSAAMLTHGHAEVLLDVMLKSGAIAYDNDEWRGINVSLPVC